MRGSCFNPPEAAAKFLLKKVLTSCPVML